MSPRDFGYQVKIERLEKRVEAVEKALFELIRDWKIKFPEKGGRGARISGIKT